MQTETSSMKWTRTIIGKYDVKKELNKGIHLHGTAPEMEYAYGCCLVIVIKRILCYDIMWFHVLTCQMEVI